MKIKWNLYYKDGFCEKNHLYKMIDVMDNYHVKITFQEKHQLKWNSVILE